LSCVAPARAADNYLTTAQGIIRSQVEALAQDDAATAYSFASSGIHERFPRSDIFLEMVRRNYAPVYRHKSFEFGEAQVVEGKVVQRAHIVDGEGVPWEALYTLEPQGDGMLKITGCALIKIGEGV
jgi:hypothetical protein